MPPSMSAPSSQSSNISMAQQRLSAAQQQMRQPMPPGFDPNIGGQPSSSMPPGSYIQGQQIMAGPPPPHNQQQFSSFPQFFFKFFFDFFLNFEGIQDKICTGPILLD